jgi:ferric-dicitrate binding protein FerR (iron transport regulator)
MSDKSRTPTRAVDKLVSLAQSTFSGDLSPHEQEGFDRLANTMASRRPWRPLRLLALVLGLSAALFVPFILAHRHSRASLSFRITSGASSVASGETSWPASRIDFSDGSSVVLEASARASVSEVGDHGARVHLDRGRLRTHFVSSHDARWLVDAGPYLATAAGTAFDLAWTPSEQLLEVWLHNGMVVIQGPLANPGISMVAGQHLRASGLTDQILVDRIEPTEATGPANATALTAPLAPTPRPTTAPRPASSRAHDL